MKSAVKFQPLKNPLCAKFISVVTPKLARSTLGVLMFGSIDWVLPRNCAAVAEAEARHDQRVDVAERGRVAEAVAGEEVRVERRMAAIIEIRADAQHDLERVGRLPIVLCIERIDIALEARSAVVGVAGRAEVTE